MVNEICIDSDIIINLLKGNQETADNMNSMDAVYVTTAINSFEIWTERKDKENIKSLLESMKILEFNKQSSLIAGNIRKKLSEEGKIIDIKDIFIASICIYYHVPLLTANKTHFSRLTKFGLQLI